jgi:D-alanine-D-alanine ligase
MGKRTTHSSMIQARLPVSPESDPDAEEPPSPQRRRLRSGGASAGKARNPSLAVEAPALLDAQSIQLTFDWPAAVRKSNIRYRSPRRPLSLADYSVVVLYSLALGLERGQPRDLLADEDTARVAAHIAEAMRGQVAEVHLVPVWDDLLGALRPFDPRRDLVFNLVESIGGQGGSEQEVPHLLQQLGFRFTGATSRNLRQTGDKVKAKRRLEKAGLITPPCQLVRRLGQLDERFPLPAIVKPVAEGGSMGITQSSVVSDARALRRQVAECLATYRQPALVESFIAGREINVAMWGRRNPEILPLSEIVFNWTDDPLKQIVSFDAKWVEDSVEFTQTPGICPAHLTAAEAQAVRSAAERTYREFGLRGFARVDMRLRDGIPYILEVNPNPDLGPGAGFYRSAAAAGYSYASMVLHILQLAFTAPQWSRYALPAV